MSDLTFGIKLKADGAGFVGQVKIARDSIEGLGKSTLAAAGGAERLVQESDKLRGALGGLKTLALQAAGAFGAWKLYSYAKDAALLNARYETLGISMDIVGKNAGYTAQQMADAALGMQQAGISMVESRSAAMRLVQAHIDLADSSKLARIAQDAAVIGNINSSEAFATMIHGIQSGQTDVLRNIGLNISMEQSYKQIAAQLGKNVDQLTQNERTQGVLNAVMAAGADIAGTYEAAMSTAGKQLNSTKRYIEDLQLKIGEVFNESLTVGVMAFTAGLKDANGQISELSQKNQLKQWGEDVMDMFAFLADAGMSAAVPFRLIGKEIGALAALTTVATSGDGLFSEKGMLQAKAIMAALHSDQQAILDSASTFRNALAERRAAQAADEAKAKAKTLAAEQDFQTKYMAILNSDLSAQEKYNAAAALAQKTYGDNHDYNKGIAPTGQSDKKTRSAGTEKNSNAAYLAALQRESDLYGMTAGQIKIYDAAKRGIVGDEMQQVMALATEADARDAATQSAKAHAKAVEEANRIIATIDPLVRANTEWEKLIALQAQGLLTSDQAGAAYAKAMGDMDKVTQAGANKMSAIWANFRDNTQRVLGDQLADGIMGKFNNIGDAFKQMLAKMAANAAAQKITEALFGGNGGSAGGGWIGLARKLFGFADGGAFGTAQAFANGGTFSNGLYTSPTPFKFARGGGFNLGVMGEAGPEAVMPLARDSSGKLGVRSQGGGSAIIVNDHTTINVDSRSDRAQVIADTSRLIEQRQAQLVERLRRERAIG